MKSKYSDVEALTCVHPSIFGTFNFLMQKMTFEATLAGPVRGASARARQRTGRAGKQWPRPMVVIVQKRIFVMCFFVFQAILNTFYF